MQTRIGWMMLCAVGLIAVALAWTCRSTGWFNPEHPSSFGWLALGTLVALGTTRVIDRALWAKKMRAKRAQKQAEIEKEQALLAQDHANSDFRAAFNNANVQNMLREPESART